LLTGLEYGVLGSLAMIVWFAGTAVRDNLHWWAMPNLVASTILGNAVFRAGMGKATVTGVSILIFAGGLLGAVHGLVARNFRGYWRSAALGLFVSLIWHALFYSSVFGTTTRLLAAYAPQPSTFAAHVVFGLVLGRNYRGTVRRFQQVAGFREAEPRPLDVDAER
jgi:hypothetical protein